MLGKRRYRKIVSSNKYGNKAEDGRRLRYLNRDDPNYRKACGKEYTPTQLKILSGETPWEIVPLNQLSMLLYKAETFKDTEIYDKVKEMRDRKIKQRDNKYTPNMTSKEAKDILRSLTPWEKDKKE